LVMDSWLFLLFQCRNSPGSNTPAASASHSPSNRG